MNQRRLFHGAIGAALVCLAIAIHTWPDREGDEHPLVPAAREAQPPGRSPSSPMSSAKRSERPKQPSLWASRVQGPPASPAEAFRRRVEERLREQRKAVRELVSRGESAADDLMARYRQDPAQRKLVRRALLELGESGRNQLVGILRAESSERKRLAILMELSEGDPEGFVPMALHVAGSDPSSTLRRLALTLLHRQGADAGALASIVRNDADLHVRGAAIATLSRLPELAGLSELERLESELSEPSLLRAVHSGISRNRH